jgi:hypothetical protein
MTKSSTPRKGAKFTADGRTWIITGVRTLPYDRGGPQRVFARSDDKYEDKRGFGTVSEWAAEFGE